MQVAILRRAQPPHLVGMLLLNGCGLELLDSAHLSLACCTGRPCRANLECLRRSQGQVLNYEISNQFHNPTHARVVQLEMLGQLRHGVAAGGKGGLNRGVAVVGVLAFKCLQRHRLRPALGARNLPARAAHAGSWAGRALFCQQAHFVDELLIAQINLSREYFPNRGQADALAHMVDVALLGFLPIQPVFHVLRWRKVGQQFAGGEPIGAGQPGRWNAILKDLTPLCCANKTRCGPRSISILS